MTKALKEYRERVERAATERSGEPIYNGSIDHASTIIERMFAHARKDICILSGELHARVYAPDDTLEQVKLFVTDGDNSVRILLETDDLADLLDHGFIEKFRDRTNVKFRRVPDEVQENYSYHFAVMDGDSYRFEEDKTEFSAVAAFGHEKGAKKLQEIFDIIWDGSGDDLDWGNLPDIAKAH